MEVADSSEDEDFRPVLKSKRKKVSVSGVEKDKVEQNLLSSNKFSPLTDNNNNASQAEGGGTPVVPASTKLKGKQKQPPLVVKNLGSNKLLAVMVSCEVKPNYKMNRFEIKVICYIVNDFDTVRAQLKNHKVKSYTHERKSE